MNNMHESQMIQEPLPRQHGSQQPMSPVHDQAVPQKRKNPLGIASVAVCIFGVLAFIGLAVLWHLLHKANISDLSAQHRIESIIVNLAYINFFATFGLGLILGVIGLFLKERRKVLAIWGIILNIAGAPFGFILFIYTGFALAEAF
ncbi:MAG: hypothetical protein Q4C71_05025 [Microbacteriaceae bacterium]|nr:hypothetical protein [Microbacteriaceae bacterium]